MSIFKNHRPPPLQALLWFVPGLVAVAVAALIQHPLTLVPLLLANTLTMAATCHAIGFDPEPRFGRTVLRRGAAYLTLFTAYVAVTFVLMAWPLLRLSHDIGAANWGLLAIAGLLALAALRRSWPAFGLVYVWDHAYPAQAEASWMFTATQRCVAFGRHLSREGRLLSDFLPAALALWLMAFATVVITGLNAIVAPELRIVALAVYAIVLLPLGCLVVANRTLRALLIDSRQARRETSATPARPPASSAAQPAMASRAEPRPILLSVAEQVAGSPEQVKALRQAIGKADLDRVKALLEAGADPNAPPDEDSSDQRSLLTLAALQPNMQLLRALITHGATLNQPAQNAMPPLLAVARDGGLSRNEAMITLLTNGADVAATDHEGNTALHHIARRNDLAAAAMLIDAEAPLDVLNAEGQSALAVACHAANWPLVELMLVRKPPLQPTGAEPALVAAADIADDDPRGVSLLLKHKAQVNARDAQGRSALIVAAKQNHLRILKTLLAAHADVTLADQHGTTALMEAAHNASEDIVRLLCEAGAPLDARDRHGRDALTLACLSPRPASGTVHALLEAGADPFAHQDDFPSAVDRVAAAGRWELLTILDPEAPVPADTGAGEQAPDDSPAHLLDALRFGHWAIAASFVEPIRQWPAEQLAKLYLDLAEGRHPLARRWLLAHGLAPEQRLANGQALFDALLRKLPHSLEAVHTLLDAGASPSGAGRLALALSALNRQPANALGLANRMLDAGADPFGALPDGRTPLHLASVPGFLPLLQRLLELGCDPNRRDDHGRMPLHEALSHPHQAAAVRALIGAGADPEAAANNGETPLGLGISHEASDSERWLRWTGWILPRRRLRAHDLPAAAAHGDAAAVEKLIELGFSVDTRDAKGSSALIHASGLGHESVVRSLLDAGADSALSAPNGITALAAATTARQLGCLQLLLQHGVAPDQRVAGEATALILACALGHADVADALAEAGADVNARDAAGHTPLHAAAQFCFHSRDSLRARRLLDVLLSRKAEPNAVDATGLTPLLLLLGAHQKPGADCDATHLGALVPVLLDAGARHDLADQHGITPLHASVMHLLLPAIRALLARGANRFAADSFGRTPADIASLLGYVDLASELGTRTGSVVPSVNQTLRQPSLE